MLYLLRRGGSATRMDIYRDIANNDRMPDKFAILEDAGLIVQTQDRFTRAVTLTLTPLGRNVAEALTGIDSDLRRTVSAGDAAGHSLGGPGDVPHDRGVQPVPSCEMAALVSALLQDPGGDVAPEGALAD